MSRDYIDWLVKIIKNVSFGREKRKINKDQIEFREIQILFTKHAWCRECQGLDESPCGWVQVVRPEFSVLFIIDW